MRVTAFMLFQQFTRNLNKNLTNLSKAQEQLSTGKKITTPSDDVIAMRGVMSYKLSVNAAAQFQRNTNEGKSLLGYTENLLNSTQSILQRARELAIPASNDTSTATERELASFEVQNLFNQLMDIGNSKLKGNYVFSGYATGTQSFDSDGIYQGDTNDMEIYINEGITTKINTNGHDAFFDDTKFISADLTAAEQAGDLSGVLRITAGSNPVVLPGSAFAFASATVEEIRDTINAPMTDFYTNDAAIIGTGELNFKVGNTDVQNIKVNAANGNTTLSTLVTYINSNVTGVEAQIAYETTEAAGSRARILFRPTTPGETFNIDVAKDGDSNNDDDSGLSALLHTDDMSNLTINATGVEAHVMNGSQGKRLLFVPNTAGTTLTVEVDRGNDGSFADGVDTDANNPAGLAFLYQNGASTNLANSVSFFTVVDNLRYSLANNDEQGIRGSIDLLDGSLDALVNVTADVGSRFKYLQEQEVMLEDNKFNFEKSRSELEDADIAEVALDVTKVQSALEALRISSMKSLTQSLIQFLN